MSVIRVNKTSDFTVMSNYHFRDKSLSLKAKGLLSQMLSLPENWDYTISGLASINKENKTAIQSALHELENGGYLVRTRTQDESGRFDYIYDIYEKPRTENLCTENQHTESPCTENKPLLNTNKTNTYKQITKGLNKEIEQEFEELWNEYPRKEGKRNALKAYEKARKQGVSKTVIMDGILRYKQHLEKNKTEPQFIKQGSTWFNQECWSDIYVEAPASKSNPHEIDPEYLKYLDSLTNK